MLEVSPSSSCPLDRDSNSLHDLVNVSTTFASNWSANLIGTEQGSPDTVIHSREEGSVGHDA
jgi:hypothetical protein